MKKSIHLSALAGAMVIAVSLGLAAIARADVVAWDESVNGKFSHDGLAAIPVTLVTGDNDILGTDGKPNASTDPVNPDYFTFTAPAGGALTAITVLPGTMSAGPVGISFIGIEAGNQITLGPTPTTAAGLLGRRHFSPADIGTDILGEIGNPLPDPMGATGFMPPLGPATTRSEFKRPASAARTFATTASTLRSSPSRRAAPECLPAWLCLHLCEDIVGEKPSKPTLALARRSLLDL
jgi:hypothetical protein